MPFERQERTIMVKVLLVLPACFLVVAFAAQEALWGLVFGPRTAQHTDNTRHGTAVDGSINVITS